MSLLKKLITTSPPTSAEIPFDAYRKSHEIDGSTEGVQTDYQIPITVNYGAGVDSGEDVYLDSKGASDFSDLRFIRSDAEQISDNFLDYWIESKTDDDQAKVWVELDTIPADPDSVEIYIYYGKVNQNSLSNGGDTFPFLDDFGSVWERQGIVLPIGDSILGFDEPTVIHEVNPQILTEETTVFKMWVRGDIAGPSYEVYYYESTDGESWTGHDDNPIIDTGEPLQGPFVVKHDGTYYMYVHGGAVEWQDVDLWTSADGVVWAKDTDTVLDVGAGGQWDDANIGNIFVWIENSTWYMIYEAKDGVGQWQLGLATSPDGRVWTREATNPVHTGATESVGGPYVKKIGATYYMWYHRGSNGGLPTDIHRASSADLLTWSEYGVGPVFARSEEYEGVGQAQGQVADPDLLRVGDETYMWYTCLKTAADKRGIALAKTSLTFAELVLTSENGLDVAKWDGDTGSANIIGNNLVFGPRPSAPSKIMQSIPNFSDPCILRANRSIAEPDTNWNLFGFGEDNSGTVNVFADLVSSPAHTRIGDADSFDTVVTDYTEGAYKVMEYWWKSNELRWFEEGVELTNSPYSTVANIPTADIPIAFVTSSPTGYIYADWVLIRKYAAPEPTNGDWGAEEPVVWPF